MFTEDFYEKQEKIKEAREYLASTDWYYARKIETGDEVPEGVAVKRKESREFIRENEC